MAIDMNAMRLGALVVITLAYALFDLFNKREVPNAFAYASVVVAAALALAYWNTVLVFGILVALFIAGFGYFLYRRGLLGGGDVFELIAIALLLPIQPVPLLTTVQQFSMPFVLSVFIASGYFAVIAIVLYYLLLAGRSPLEKNFRIEKGRVLRAAALVAVYVLLIIMIKLVADMGYAGIIILLILAVPSGIMMVYEKLINYRMVSMLYPRQLIPEDMIATNLMARKDISYFRKRSAHFGRLATNSLIKDLRGERKKLPVYRNAAPLAAFFFVGVVFSLLLGNLIFLVIG